ncbi:hypothetical protein OROMI_014017 [Orobanche minor]
MNRFCSAPIRYPSLRLFRHHHKMATEPSLPVPDWDLSQTFTDEELEAIDAICRSATYTSSSSSSLASPMKKRHVDECTDNHDSTVSRPGTRRRLPESLFTFRKELHATPSLAPCSRSRFHSRNYTAHTSPYQEMKFGGRIVYSRTAEEVEKAAVELLQFIEAKKRKEGECILGLDIEWRPTFRRGVAPGKAAVMQICGDNNSCHVMHIIHSGIPKNLQLLLEDPTSVKVGIGIAGDMTKVFKDHDVSINSLGDLSSLANLKLGGIRKAWSMASLTEQLMCRQEAPFELLITQVNGAGRIWNFTQGENIEDNLPKPKRIRLGNWEVKVLSQEQLKYAATDAYASWYLYQALKSLPDAVVPKSEETCPEKI